MPPGITVVGLGPGDASLITRQAWRVLEEAAEVVLKTGLHPAVSHLPPHLTVTTFDELLEQDGSPEETSETIVDALLGMSDRELGVIYAVPGDPLVADASVAGLKSRAGEAGIPVKILHGVSFVEPCLKLAGLESGDGLIVVDAVDVTGRYHPSFPPDMPVLAGQLHSRKVASKVKLCLMNQYHPEHPVLLIHAPGTPEAAVESVPLVQIDQSQDIGPMTALLVRPTAPLTSFESFQETVAHLRAPDGCPWDREQTHLSLRSHLLGETYEALEALDRESVEDLREELGDLMLQLVIQVQIATEDGEFQMADVLSGINNKLIRRHPHVFGGMDVENVSEVLHNWEALKEQERKEGGNGKGSLDGVPGSLPALAQALEFQSRAARVGFDWPDVSGVLAKVDEEVREVQDEDGGDAQAAELGDLFFALVNVARWLDIDPEAALRGANQRFKARFARVEAAAWAEGKSLSKMDIEALEALWQAAKRQEAR
ncbi:MAG: nucleoside triphosphate pyrophosphohydrolase [Anaerolineales bacterium]|jgi:tetrapyrrole methylase family protein/MazG family protein